jgi:AcrR family transcriptional regulator
MAADTRDALLDLGTCLLLEAGYNATGVQAVLAAAGVPKGSFYYHFDTKEAFALEAVDRYFALQCRVLTNALGGDGPWLERLERYFEFLVRDYEAADFRRGCLLGTLGQETAASNDALRARIATAFDRGRGRRHARPRRGRRFPGGRLGRRGAPGQGPALGPAAAALPLHRVRWLASTLNVELTVRPLRVPSTNRPVY